jgi:hypothetical protein
VPPLRVVKGKTVQEQIASIDVILSRITEQATKEIARLRKQNFTLRRLVDGLEEYRALSDAESQGGISGDEPEWSEGEAHDETQGTEAAAIAPRNQARIQAPKET